MHSGKALSSSQLCNRPALGTLARLEGATTWQHLAQPALRGKLPWKATCLFIPELPARREEPLAKAGGGCWRSLAKRDRSSAFSLPAPPCLVSAQQGLRCVPPPVTRQVRDKTGDVPSATGATRVWKLGASLPAPHPGPHGKCPSVAPWGELQFGCHPPVK